MVLLSNNHGWRRRRTRRSNKINTILHDRCYLQKCKATTFEKVANYTKYKKTNVPSHLHIFLLTVCSYHGTYAFQSESTLYSCLNVKELLARSRRKIWSLSDCNGTQTHNHLVRKRTLKHLVKLASLAKWLSVRLQTKWLWVRVPLQSLKLQISHLLWVRSSLTFRQL